MKPLFVFARHPTISSPTQTNMTQNPRNLRGFTLIELMIVIAIIGILLAVALPAYQSQIIKGRRLDARSALLELSSREEKFYAISNQYSATASDLGYPSFPFPITSSGNGSSYYSLDITIGGGASYVATATPTAAQTQDEDCYAFRIDQTGARTNLNANGQNITWAGCW